MGARGEHLLEQFEFLHLFLLGEFDVELDVEVAELVVAKRGHALAFDHLDFSCKAPTC
jgi:hypothetical protein